jgi:FtsP/CotA-like multicopper oxidase with cupredoxin domain
VTQTGCPSGCANNGLGNANGIFLYDDADATLPTSTPGNVTAANFAICADEPIGKISPWLVKSAGTASAFSSSASTIPGGLVTNVQTPDDGVVFRWFLNNGAIDIDYAQPTLQTLASSGSANASAFSNPIILESKNEWVYFVIQNQFFAGHPMHLHGHDFSLLGQGTTAWNPSLVSTLNFANPVRR